MGRLADLLVVSGAEFLEFAIKDRGVIVQNEFSATEVRDLLIRIFPYRKLVLSQFTLFNHRGVFQATGSSFKRRRRCYRLQDLLSISCILALKEKGIQLKNISVVPQLIQQNTERIFDFSSRSLLTGFGSSVSLKFDQEVNSSPELELFLSGAGDPALFWSFDLTDLARQLVEAAAAEAREQQVAA